MLVRRWAFGAVLPQNTRVGKGQDAAAQNLAEIGQEKTGARGPGFSVISAELLFRSWLFAVKFPRGAPDDIFQLFQLDEIIGLTAKFV